MAAPGADSLIPFPSDFPVKVIGLQVEGFEAAVVAVAQLFDPALDETRIECRPSSGGKTLGLTLTITATSRAQLDELYRSSSTHPRVKVLL